MKALPNTWTRQGFAYRVIARCGMVVLVERLPCGIGAIPHFEVARVTAGEEKRLPGQRVLQEREVYPASELWGTHGWTYSTLESARAKFEALTVKVRTNKELTP